MPDINAKQRKGYFGSWSRRFRSIVFGSINAGPVVRQNTAVGACGGGCSPHSGQSGREQGKDSSQHSLSRIQNGISCCSWERKTHVSKMGCSKISIVIRKSMRSTQTQEPDVHSSCSDHNRPESVWQVGRAQACKPDQKWISSEAQWIKPWDHMSHMVWLQLTTVCSAIVEENGGMLAPVSRGLWLLCSTKSSGNQPRSKKFPQSSVCCMQFIPQLSCGNKEEGSCHCETQGDKWKRDRSSKRVSNTESEKYQLNERYSLQRKQSLGHSGECLQFCTQEDVWEDWKFKASLGTEWRAAPKILQTETKTKHQKSKRSKKGKNPDGWKRLE